MLKNYPNGQIKEKLSTSGKILVVLPADLTFDSVAAALSLRLALVEVGKDVLVYCPQPMTVEYNRLVGVDQITQKLQGTDMVVTLNYPVDQIERVSYNDDNGHPNVVIQPKNGAPQLAESLASFHFAGVGADLVFLIGDADPSIVSGLGESTTLVSLGYENRGSSGVNRIEVADPAASCLSEVVLGLINGLSLPVSADTAQNILDGLWQSTNSLTGQMVGPDTYEAVSICLRSGAIRPVASPSSVSGRPAVRSNLMKEKPVPAPVDPSPVQPPPARKDNPPSDWLQPKIYRGTSTA